MGTKIKEKNKMACPMKIIYFLLMATVMIMWISTTSLPYWFKLKQREFKLRFFGEDSTEKPEKKISNEDLETDDDSEEHSMSDDDKSASTYMEKEDLKNV